ncbi:DUF349 domain-containing protein [Rothia kristinae]|uniref:DUF349 domain-containing protein n=1 Tax=Rothia kristinae TaxID=37923 RepID=UPI0021A50EE7|nr:DUF349 domain-containing protein [Rothia kristinae]MCT1357912.1 DUF349 domain-containing protein [Rothia kristinae]MCT1393608.1 DUF349 domain-containing protein [Rothia kristinae]MCT1505804.1 DUF349 domain-containing protein [Rothia kristinae]MCT2038353.1 DUF349 domain-containing protein [Rothia kristinae]MCT2243538.1 DUF349 domain-containing protein [Rothia kristinae]
MRPTDDHSQPASAPRDAAAPDSSAPNASASESTAPKPAAPKPAAPKPSALRRGPAPRPAATPGARPAATTPVHAPSTEDPAALAEAASHGRVCEDGQVVVVVAGEEVPVGAYPEAGPEEALRYFARKHLELLAQIALLEGRVQRGAGAQEARRALATLREQAAARRTVGDLAALDARLEELHTRIDALEAEQRETAQRAREEAVADRERIVAAAEEVAAQDPQTLHWKDSSTRLNQLFDAWKQAQRTQRLPKAQDDALWARFRAARSGFERMRKKHFSDLDQRNAQAVRIKEGLIAEAEALQGSTDWGETSGRYRELMQRWKQAPRAARREDDALWARFRAAQDVFFAARTAANEQTEQEFRENLRVKEELLQRARAVLPVQDPERAKAQLAPILEAWDETGMVPRTDFRRIESELQKVQNAVAEAEQREWERSDPETRARADSMLGQLRETIAQEERALAEAEQAGDERRARQAREALETRRAWLAQLEAADR